MKTQKQLLDQAHRNVQEVYHNLHAEYRERPTPAKAADLAIICHIERDLFKVVCDDENVSYLGKLNP